MLGTMGPGAASPVSAINLVRDRVCARTAAPVDLRETALLDAAASELARGASLHAVLGHLPARPASASAVRLANVGDDASVARRAAERFCHELAAPGLTDIGVAHADGGLWVIVTEPFAEPAADDAGTAPEVFVRLVNAARGSGRRCGRQYYPAVPPVAWSDPLYEVARAYARELAAREAVEHEGLDGSNAAQRVRRSGLNVGHVGENLASGVPTAREVVEGWLDSPGHCAVIMDPRFTSLAVAHDLRPRSRSAIYWTMLLTEPVRRG